MAILKNFSMKSNIKCLLLSSLVVVVILCLKKLPMDEISNIPAHKESSIHGQELKNKNPVISKQPTKGFMAWERRLGYISVPNNFTSFLHLWSSETPIISEECISDCAVNGFHLAAIEIACNSCYCSNFTPGIQELRLEDKINITRVCGQEVFCSQCRHFLLYKTSITEVNTPCGVISLSRPGTWKPTALASYPGSGNTWTRHILQYTTGIFTGSVYNDRRIFMGGFIGELENDTTGTTIIIKTHRQPQKNTHAILLIRNPFDAILALFNLYSTKSLVASIKDMEWPTRAWKKFAMTQIEKWSDFIFEWLMDVPDILVVHYEDMVHNLQNEVQRMVHFLTDDYPQDDRLRCTLKWKEGLFHRKKKSSSHYSFDMQDKFDKHIIAVSMALDSYLKKPLPGSYSPRVTPADEWPLPKSEMSNIARRFTKDKNFIQWKQG